MAYYQQRGMIPPKRHTQHRDETGALFYEELMGEEGFSADSSLLYHRYIPSALRAARPWDLPDLTTVPNEPLLPRHLALHDLFSDGAADADLVLGRRLVLGNDDVRISYAVGSGASPLYRNAVGDECVFIEDGQGVCETVFGPVPFRSRRLRGDPAGHDAPVRARRAGACLRDRGQLAHHPGPALPVEVRSVARARPVLRTRPARPRRARRDHRRRGHR